MQRMSAVLKRRLVSLFLWTQAHAAFQGDGLPGHVFEIRGAKVYAHPPDVILRVAKPAHGNGLQILLVSLGVGGLEVLQLGGHGQGADHVDIDIVLAPLCGRHPGKSPDALLGRRVGALSRIAEQAGSGGEVDD